MLTPNKRKSEHAFRLLLAASQRNDIPEGDEEAQIIDLMRNLNHMVEDYAIDLTDCFAKASELYQADIAE